MSTWDRKCGKCGADVALTQDGWMEQVPGKEAWRHHVCAGGNAPAAVERSSGPSSPVIPIPLRAYAAIQLRVPDSGIEWLDAMILKALQADKKVASDG